LILHQKEGGNDIFEKGFIGISYHFI